MTRAATAGPARAPADFYERHQGWPAALRRRVARHLRGALGPSPRRCLFLGAATGVNDAIPFARLAGPRDRVIASDVEPDYLGRLREAAGGLGNLGVRRIDVTRDLGDLGPHDLVALFFVIHRVGGWRGVVAGIPPLLRRGGSFFISEFAGPRGIIYLSNEGGGAGRDPVSRMIRRYFELLPGRFAPGLKSTRIRPVLEALAGRLRPAGHRDFAWPQELTAAEMYGKIEARAYAPYFGTRPTPEVLARLREEFLPEWGRRVRMRETVRIYRFMRG